jgi:hypothetical protein
MPIRLFTRIDAIVAADLRAAEATRNMHAAIGTEEWPQAVRTYRSCANAALFRAVWRSLASQRLGRRAAAAGPAGQPLGTAFAEGDAAPQLRP